MTAPLIVPVIGQSLGNPTYLRDLGDGRALVLDPSRDQPGSARPRCR